MHGLEHSYVVPSAAFLKIEASEFASPDSVNPNEALGSGLALTYFFGTVIRKYV
jgi:hypothetical protein